MAAYIELEDAWPCQSVQLFSRVQFIATPWTAARQASLSITNSKKNTVLQVAHTFYLFFHVDVKFSYKLYGAL